MSNIIQLQENNIQPNEGGLFMCKVLENLKEKTPIELLKENNISLNPPIDIGELLQKLNISTKAVDFSEVEDIKKVKRGSVLGATFSDKDDLFILYKESDTYNRQLFTIAHELGHCCLHTDTLKINHIEYRDEEKKCEKREIDANIFAGELLIPEDSLMFYYRKFIVPSLESLAKIFGVSTNVMAARLDHLNLNYYKDTAISED